MRPFPFQFWQALFMPSAGNPTLRPGFDKKRTLQRKEN
jgi:hypothetical protein